MTQSAGDGKASESKQGAGTTSAFSFRKPSKQLKSASNMGDWKRSQLYADVTGFIMALNNVVKGTSRETQRSQSAVGSFCFSTILLEDLIALCLQKVKLVVEFLRDAKGWIKDIPPLPQAMRFGNKAFCIWHAHMLKALPKFLEALVGSDLHKAGASEELTAYLDGSFGHPQRIDYGTGEPSFARS